MKKMKKLIAVALTSVIMAKTGMMENPVLSAPYNANTTVSAFDADKYEDLLLTAYDTYIEITACNESATEVVIPESIDGLPVKTIGEWAFWNCTNLTSVTIPDGITDIGYSAFSSCTSLTDITIPRTVTNIGEFAFSGCTSLTDINVEQDNLVYCGIDGNLYTKNGIDILCVPEGKQGTITIPDTVTCIYNNAFAGCTGLTDITIPDKVTSIGSSAFFYCTGLTSITIPKSTTRIGDYAFEDCSNLIDINVEADNTNYCSINGILYSADVSEMLCVPAGKEGIITIPARVTDISENAFSNCIHLTSITVDANNMTYCDNDGILYTKDMKNLVNVPMGKRGSIVIPDGVTNIGNSAFSNCTGLTSITLPNSIINIGVSAFSGCFRLTNITLPSSLTFIGNMAFYGSYELKDVYYEGTESQWSEIEMGIDNESLTSASIHYNSSGMNEEWNPNPDMDGDGIITASDAQIVLLAYLDMFIGNTPELTPEQLVIADLNQDGKVTANDSQYILLYYLYNTVIGERKLWTEIINMELT